LRPGRPQGFRVQITSGATALNDIGYELDALQREVGVPVTARRPWLNEWFRHTPNYSPLVISIGTGARLSAAAALATRSIGPLVSVTDAGHGASDYQVFAARDGTAAFALADGISCALRALHRPWFLRVDQLPDADPVTSALVQLLPLAQTESGVGSPAALVEPVRSLGAVMSKSARQSVRTSRRRVVDEGATLDFATTKNRKELQVLLAEVSELKRHRDFHARGRSDMDVARNAGMWRDIIMTHAEQGEVELVTVRIRGDLAAYSIAFLDGRAYRVWDFRYHPGLGRYSPGRLLGHALLQRVLEDTGLNELDWMNGEEPYKMSMSTIVVPHVRLRAWSSRLTQQLERVAARRSRH
jgi:CelD/BcsL family acetyltransferase involved in cellulose biosynthesis